MADPPTEGPEPPPNPHSTSTQETIASVAKDDRQARTVIDTASLLNENRKRTRVGDAFTPSDPASRTTTREVWKFISSLTDIIRHQIAAIGATQIELQVVKHGQHLLQDQKDKLQAELKALREQIAAGPPIVPATSWTKLCKEAARAQPRPPRDRLRKNRTVSELAFGENSSIQATMRTANETPLHDTSQSEPQTLTSTPHSQTAPLHKTPR
jgi:hypothetical protein